jgi:hypothetical protein
MVALDPSSPQAFVQEMGDLVLKLHDWEKLLPSIA